MSPLQQVDLVRQDRLFIAEKRDQDTQPDRGLSYRVATTYAAIMWPVVSIIGRLRSRVRRPARAAARDDTDRE